MTSRSPKLQNNPIWAINFCNRPPVSQNIETGKITKREFLKAEKSGELK